MAITRQQKETVITNLKDQFGRMKAVVFAGYRGMNVASVTTLRDTLRDNDIDYAVIKKTLIQKAAADSGVTGFDIDVLEGPTAVVIGYDDEVLPARLLKAHSKIDDKLVMFAGIMDGKLISGAQVMQLASLPGKDELRAKILGSMMSPIAGFTRVIKGPINGFYNILLELQKKGA